MPSEEGPRFDYRVIVNHNANVFAPEVIRAERILLKMNAARRLNQGAFGLDIPGSDGDKEMVDEPMLKQVSFDILPVYIYITHTFQAIKTIHAARRR